jgi:hypothetical protein
VAEQKIKMQLPDGKMVDAVNVPIEESTERWSEFVLDDGTRIRAKVTILDAQRAVSDYDPLGQPWYRINVQPMMTIVEIPEHLKKKEQ